MLITAYPYRYLGPQALTFNSAEAFERLRGEHSAHEYYRFDYDATTYEQDNLVGLVPFDPIKPADWFAFVEEFAPLIDTSSPVPLGAYVLAVACTERRLLNTNEFRDAVSRIKLTPESALAYDDETDLPLPPYDKAQFVCYKGKDYYIETVVPLDKADEAEQGQQSLDF
jgi:hypothetical protein